MSTRNKALLATLLLSCCALMLHHRELLFNPNSHMINTQGDGLKNYFTFAWHVRHDTSAFTFSGMNAPFGEHINYPDAQPLASNAWRGVAGIWPQAEEQSVGLVNLLVVMSIPLSALFLCLALIELRTPWVLAAVGAVLVALMSMQNLRGLQAHYALAYSWCIPSVIWLGLRHRRASRKWHSAGWAFLVVSCWLWVHVYLGFIAALVLLIWAGLSIPSKRARAHNFPLFLGPFSALVLFQVITWSTDTHSGRTEHPFGFFHYHTTWDTLLRPDHMWTSPLARELLGTCTPQAAEQWSYLGMGTILLVACLPFFLLVQRPFKRADPDGGSGLWAGAPGLLVTSLMLLLLAFAAPYRWGFEELLWDTPVVRQFRAPSRFSWVVQFVLPLVLIAWYAHLHGRAERPLGRWSLRGALVLGLALMAYEAHHLHLFIGDRSVDEPNVFLVSSLTAEQLELVERANEGGPRAIVSIPYFHNGAEELMVPVNENGLFLGQLLAYHSGIPMMSSSLTRTSLEEVRLEIRAHGPTWYERPELPGMDAHDSVLVLIGPDLADPYDSDLLERTRSVRSHGSFRSGWMSVADLLKDDRQARLGELKARADSLYRKGPFLVADTTAFLYHDGFDDRGSSHVLQGPGSFSGPKRMFNSLAEFPPNTFQSGLRYIARFWYYNRGPMRCHAFVGIDERDPESGQGWWDHYTDPRFSRTLDGDWSLVELPFSVRDASHEVKLFLQGERYYPDSVFIDELVISEATSEWTLVQEDGVVWWNGHRLRP